MSIVVTTPTGNIGRRVAQRLRAAGAAHTLFVRDAGRLDPAERAGARVVEGSLDDGAALRRALDGARALFLVVPPHLTTDDWAAFQRGVGRAAADAVAAAGVERVVFVSSAGAQRDDMYAVTRLGEVERLLADAVPHLAVLRPGFFLENFLGAVPTIVGDGAVYLTLPPDRRMPLVATADIGDVAAERLLDAGWRGRHVLGLHGAADVSPAEAVRAFAAALGRPLRYVQVPASAMRDVLLQAGASAHVADEYPRLMEAIGALDYVAEPRTAQTTTPTTVESWARTVLVPAVAGAAPALAAR